MLQIVEYHVTASHQAPDWTTERLVIIAMVPAGQALRQ